MIKLNLNFFGHQLPLQQYQERVTAVHARMQQKVRKRLVQDMLGWLMLPDVPQPRIDHYLEFGQRFRRDIEVLVVIGIGGSFLGIKACLDWWGGMFGNSTKIKTIFIGNSLGGRELADTLRFLTGKRYGVCVISKSGTTVEPLVALNLISKQLKTDHGTAFYQQHVVVVTTLDRGKLFALAQQEHWSVFGIEPDVGGRFSFLSAVGLVPLSIVGVDLRLLLSGAVRAKLDTASSDLAVNSAYQYAVARFLMYHQFHYRVEVMGVFDQSLTSFTMWWQQLYAESEGKDGKGLLPLCCTFTRDLHSLEQFFQQGSRQLLFQTIFEPFFCDQKVQVVAHEPIVDQIYQLPLVAVNTINRYVFEAIVKANQAAHIPTLVLTFHFRNRDLAYVFGYLVFWFMCSCAMSAQLLGVNAFNQPGVELYKSILRAKMKRDH